MKAIIYVDPVLALKEGKNLTGRQTIEFDPNDLSQAERDELAKTWLPKEEAFRVNENGRPPASEASMDVLHEILATRIEEANKKAAEKAEQVAKDEEEIMAWAQLPVSGRVDYDYRGRYQVKFPHIWSSVNSGTTERFTRDLAKKNPQVAEALTAAEQEAKRLNEEALF